MNTQTAIREEELKNHVAVMFFCKKGQQMTKILGWVSLWPPIMMLSLLCCEIAFRYPCNHGAGFYCYLYPVCGLIVVSFVYGFLLKGSKVGLCLSLMCLLLILCSDWFNVYVDYNIWTRRGMPDWGQPTFVNVKSEAGE